MSRGRKKKEGGWGWGDAFTVFSATRQRRMRVCIQARVLAGLAVGEADERLPVDRLGVKLHSWSG